MSHRKLSQPAGTEQRAGETARTASTPPALGPVPPPPALPPTPRRQDGITRFVVLSALRPSAAYFRSAR